VWGRRVVGLEATGDVGTAKVSFAVPVSRVTCPLPCRCPVWRVNRRARVPCGLSLRRPDLLARPANGVRSRRSRLARPARPDVGSTCCAPRRPFVLFLPARSFVASDHYCCPHRKGIFVFRKPWSSRLWSALLLPRMAFQGGPRRLPLGSLAVRRWSFAVHGPYVRHPLSTSREAGSGAPLRLGVNEPRGRSSRRCAPFTLLRPDSSCSVLFAADRWLDWTWRGDHRG